MAIINHTTYGPNDNLEQIIIKEDGSPLYGEIDMFRRIYKDCKDNSLVWHFWHNLRFPISINSQSEIQVDFLLASKKGIVIIEVKGGRIKINNGIYYYEYGATSTPMLRTPFDQASDYRYALINHKIINSTQLFITTVCAFPHTEMSETNPHPGLDYGYKLWSKIDCDDNEASFADFCIDVLTEDKKRASGGRGWNRGELSDDDVEIAIKYLTNSFRDRSRVVYEEPQLASIAQRLKIDNLNALKSLRKNDRLFIEGGPGTGKTTIARAYIDKHQKQRGLYLCWNSLLEAKIKNDLLVSGFNRCKVKQYASLVLAIQNEIGDYGITLRNIASGEANEKIKSLLIKYRSRKEFCPYDYIVIDEAQDIIENGAMQLIQYLTSITQDGIDTGRYLILYDVEQGYNSHSRQISETMESISVCGAHYILDENKRVPTNIEIVSFANKLIDEYYKAEDLFQEIEHSSYESIKIHRYDSIEDVIEYLNDTKDCIEQENKQWDDYVVLGISSLQYIKTEYDETVYDRISSLYKIKELNSDNICNGSKELPFTTIRSYKGLESGHVILIVDSCQTAQKIEELYIGMTRAIIDLRILVLNL